MLANAELTPLNSTRTIPTSDNDNETVGNELWVDASSTTSTSQDDEAGTTSSNDQADIQTSHAQAPFQTTNYSRQIHQWRTHVLVVCLGLLSGLAHVICQERYEFFGHMMTGNTVRFAQAIAAVKVERILLYTVLLSSYGFGATLFRLVDVYCSNHSVEDEDDASARDAVGLDAKQSQSIASLALTAPACFVTFCMGDLFYAFFLRNRRFEQYRLALLAVGFGLINAAFQNCIQTVTNAVTGHITKVGLSVADILCFGSSKDGSSGSFVLSFIASIAVSTVACGWIHQQPLFTDTLLSRAVPPIGMSFGMLYYGLIRWYTDPVLGAADGGQRGRTDRSRSLA